MRLKNTSHYPEAEIRSLVEFGMHGVNTTGLQVNVKNTGRGIAGMAYEGVPCISPAAKLKSVTRLVTLRVGPPESFPITNVREFPEGPWLPGPAPPLVRPLDLNSWRYQARWNSENGVEHRRLIRRPYGGKSSPEYTCADWREGVVAIAAHEGRHIYQYQHGKRRSEVDAERTAMRALERWRAERTA